MKLSLINAPDDEPLTLAEARARVPGLASVTDDGALLALIMAARQALDGRDGWLGRAIMTQTWELRIDRFDSLYYGLHEKGFYPAEWEWQRDYYFRTLRSGERGIVIPLPPLQSIDSVKYLDSADVEQTLDASTYIVREGAPSCIVLAPGKSWPSTSIIPECIAIRFTAGYGSDGADVDERIRMAIATQAGYLRSLVNRDPDVTREQIGEISRSYSGAGVKVINEATSRLLEGLRVWTQ